MQIKSSRWKFVAITSACVAFAVMTGCQSTAANKVPGMNWLGFGKKKTPDSGIVADSSTPQPPSTTSTPYPISGPNAVASSLGYPQSGNPIDTLQNTASQAAYGAQQVASQAAYGAQQAAGQAAYGAQQAAGQAAYGAQQAAGQAAYGAQQAVSGAAYGAANQVSQAAAQAAYGAQQAVGGYATGHYATGGSPAYTPSAAVASAPQAGYYQQPSPQSGYGNQTAASGQAYQSNGAYQANGYATGSSNLAQNTPVPESSADYGQYGGYGSQPSGAAGYQTPATTPSTTPYSYAPAGSQQQPASSGSASSGYTPPSSYGAAEPANATGGGIASSGAYRPGTTANYNDANTGDVQPASYAQDGYSPPANDSATYGGSSAYGGSQGSQYGSPAASTATQHSHTHGSSTR